MAVRFAGPTDQLTYSGSLPGTAGGITVVFWVYLSVDRDANSCVTRLSASGTSIVYLTTGSDGTVMVWFSLAGSIITAFNLAPGAWHRIAATHAAGTGTLYTATATGATNVDTGTITTGSPGDLGIGGRGPGDTSEPFNGRVGAYKLYAGVLTQAEIEAEWQQMVPRRTAGLHAWYPLLDSSDRTDYSGNGRTLTAGATAATTEDGPPIPWGPPAPQLILPAPVGNEVTGTALAQLGGLTAMATGIRETSGAALAVLGGLSATATGRIGDEPASSGYHAVYHERRPGRRLPRAYDTTGRKGYWP